jgi:adenine phosphoribosyltransferase
MGGEGLDPPTSENGHASIAFHRTFLQIGLPIKTARRMNLETMLRQRIQEVPDFPIPGVNFKDITPIFLDPELMRQTAEALAAPWMKKGITRVVGIESRGFLFGPQVAQLLNAGFVIVRKVGKLPPETSSITYSLEYGNATIEMAKGSVGKGDAVLIHDDLLATGGTASATATLAGQLGATVCGYSFMIELGFLGGRKLLSRQGLPVEAIIQY